MKGYVHYCTLDVVSACDTYAYSFLWAQLLEWSKALFPLEQHPEQIGNRTRVDILASILKVASNGALKTHIMYKANLSHRQLEKYLAFLEEKHLLARHVDEYASTRVYRVTEKGLDFLREYSHVSGFFGKIS